MMARRHPHETLSLLFLGALLTGCGAPAKDSSQARRAQDDSAAFVEAFALEATGDPKVAEKAYLALLDKAIHRPESPMALPLALASLDALVHRTPIGLRSFAPRSALVFRTGTNLATPLEALHHQGDDPFLPGLIAQSLVSLAEFQGDAARAERFRKATGCAQEATVIGPLDWAALTGVEEAGAHAGFQSPIATEYATTNPFQGHIQPTVVAGRGCELVTTASSAAAGVRDVVLDVPVAEAGTIGVALRSPHRALLRVGGRIVLERPHDAGGRETTRFATVQVTKGVLRVVARVGLLDDDGPIAIFVTDKHGRPLASRAPRPGDAATAKALAHETIVFPQARALAEQTLVAAAHLASGDTRTAERQLSPLGSIEGRAPATDLLYARALDDANDLSQVYREERARAAYERILDTWPNAWEAILAHAELAASRRGQEEAPLHALRDLESHRAKAGSLAAPLLDAYEAAVSGGQRLFDRAHQAYERARNALPSSPLTYDAALMAYQRSGQERVTFACAPPRSMGHRDSLDCWFALHTMGQLDAAHQELERYKVLHGVQAGFAHLEMDEAIAKGDAKTIDRLWKTLLPSERQASWAPFLPSWPQTLDARRSALLALFKEQAMTARDAPRSYPSLMRTVVPDPLTEWDKNVEAKVRADRQRRAMPEAATAILDHKEVYDVDPTGLTHAVLLDLRRVSGTKDVEENAEAYPAEVHGRAEIRVLRRRIHKADGRIVEPDPAPNAGQSHADLAQLEAGDIVEMAYEGWLLPAEGGTLAIDSPDLLPDRVSVHNAVIQITLPENLAPKLWAHALLGKPSVSSAHGRRTVKFQLANQPPRRVEYGAPVGSESVRISFSTLTWQDVGRALHETEKSLEDKDPEVAAWARAAGGQTKAGTVEQVRAVVEAVGLAVKESNPTLLSDFALGQPSSSQMVTARSILTTHEGSRSWLLARALRELGTSADIVLAEDEPTTPDPSYPPHLGRFTHPLVVAHLASKEGAADSGDVWIDADVAGPPLPAGQVSPDLRGRFALWSDGRVMPLANTVADIEKDEVDIRLRVDEKGDAHGSFTVLLRGRDAQHLSEALFRLVGQERERALRTVVLAWLPEANVDSVSLSSSEGSWQVALRSEVSLVGFAGFETAKVGSSERTGAIPGLDPLHRAVQGLGAMTFGASYLRQADRDSALAIHHATNYHVRRRVELPAGVRVLRTPGPFMLEQAPFRAERNLLWSKSGTGGPILEEDFRLDVATGTVETSQYPAFVRHARSIDAAFLASTRLGFHVVKAP